MEMLKLNETPVRTARNFGINNVKLTDVEIPNEIKEFKNVVFENKSTKDNVKFNEASTDFNLTYGLSKDLENQVKNNSNVNLKIEINSKMNNEFILDFNFDNSNQILVENIEIEAAENTKSTIYIKYVSECNLPYYNNGVIRVHAKENSEVNVFLVNFLSKKANNFVSMENIVENNSTLNYTIIDLGGKNTISNFYSNVQGDNAKSTLNSIYLGIENQVIDMNYIINLFGKKTTALIEVQGALKDEAKKSFKGTIDFRRGCKKAFGDENENCMLLSENAKSYALPMLLCSEEEVEGNHSSSSGKVGEKELFYIMSRGFSLKEAQKLLVRANFNKVLENIKNEGLKEFIVNKIDEKLD